METMEHLPQTKGKGVLMFAKRRQMMDISGQLSAEQDDIRQKGKGMDSVVEPQGRAQVPHIYEKQQQPQSINGMNGLDPYQGSAVPRPLVPNRTAKPFLSGHNQEQKSFSPVRGVSTPTPKKPENLFKVTVPVNASPQVWSPTSDIIASRDERIAIPAIKRGILPETKRRGANKMDMKETTLLQNKGDQKESFLEEDLLGLGAEACNFMQVPTVKQKNPPPVLPKPVINPAHPPWSIEGQATTRSPLAIDTPCLLGHIKIQAGLQQKSSGLQHTRKVQPPWSSKPKTHHASPAWVSYHSSDLHQSTWSPEPQQTHHTPNSLRAGISQSKTSLVSSQNDGNSVVSCPPQHLSTYAQSSKSTERLNLKGKGAELFARRQSRMEKFVVDDETLRVNKARSSSPTLSMPSTWKYSSNVRAPPPASYNPILTPFYPLKQPPPATSPKIKPKAKKEKINPLPKHLNVLDVMKHQPYQLNSSLFTYNYAPETKKAVSPKESPKTFPKNSQPVKQNPTKVTGEVSVPYPFFHQSTSNKAPVLLQQLDGKQRGICDGPTSKLVGSACLSPGSPVGNVFVGSALPLNNEYVSRCALSVVPKPKFSAKKSNIGAKQWKAVNLQH